MATCAALCFSFNRVNTMNNSMELNINSIMDNSLYDPVFYSDSPANSGFQHIGQLTWDRAKESDIQLVTPENRECIIDYFLEYGAWDREELDKDPDLNALLIQEISAELNARDIGLEHSIIDKIEQLGLTQESDQYSTNIFYGVDNNFYICLDS